MSRERIMLTQAIPAVQQLRMVTLSGYRTCRNYMANMK